eukprot:766043-Hanusia_phi.AAC.1
MEEEEEVVVVVVMMMMMVKGAMGFVDVLLDASTSVHSSFQPIWTFFFDVLPDKIAREASHRLSSSLFHLLACRYEHLGREKSQSETKILRTLRALSCATQRVQDEEFSSSSIAVISVPCLLVAPADVAVRTSSCPWPDVSTEMRLSSLTCQGPCCSSFILLVHSSTALTILSFLCLSEPVFLLLLLLNSSSTPPQLLLLLNSSSSSSSTPPPPQLHILLNSTSTNSFPSPSP